MRILGNFPLPSETDDEVLRETYLYMTLRAVMIRNLLDAGMSYQKAMELIESQDEVWEGLGGQITGDD